METLSFGASYNYDTRQLGITVPVSLSYGVARVELHAKVDSGASACIGSSNTSRTGRVRIAVLTSTTFDAFSKPFQASM